MGAKPTLTRLELTAAWLATHPSVTAQTVALETHAPIVHNQALVHSIDPNMVETEAGPRAESIEVNDSKFEAYVNSQRVVVMEVPHELLVEVSGVIAAVVGHKAVPTNVRDHMNIASLTNIENNQPCDATSFHFARWMTGIAYYIMVARMPNGAVIAMPGTGIAWLTEGLRRLERAGAHFPNPEYTGDLRARSRVIKWLEVMNSAIHYSGGASLVTEGVLRQRMLTMVGYPWGPDATADTWLEEMLTLVGEAVPTAVPRKQLPTSPAGKRLTDDWSDGRHIREVAVRRLAFRLIKLGIMLVPTHRQKDDHERWCWAPRYNEVARMTCHTRAAWLAETMDLADVTDAEVNVKRGSLTLTGHMSSIEITSATLQNVPGAEPKWHITGVQMLHRDVAPFSAWYECLDPGADRPVAGATAKMMIGNGRIGLLIRDGHIHSLIRLEGSTMVRGSREGITVAGEKRPVRAMMTSLITYLWHVLVLQCAAVLHNKLPFALDVISLHALAGNQKVRLLSQPDDVRQGREAWLIGPRHPVKLKHTAYTDLIAVVRRPP